MALSGAFLNLRVRGWLPTLIQQLLGRPDALQWVYVPTQRPVCFKLYDQERVVQAEQSTQFLKVQARFLNKRGVV